MIFSCFRVCPFVYKINIKSSMNQPDQKKIILKLPVTDITTVVFIWLEFQ